MVPEAALAASAHADPSWLDLVASDGRILSKTLGLEFRTDDLVSRGYSLWVALARIGWKFTRIEPSGLLARRGALSLQLTTDEERDMAAEIFLARCYDLQLPGCWHVVDIGANVGMAALFFAEFSWVSRVTAFEPFSPTADIFEQQLKLNPALAPKITLIRTGLDETDTMRTVDYSSECRGSMSLSGVGTWSGRGAPSAQAVAITVAKASSLIAPIVANRGTSRLLGKIDCEGSEYGILRDLATTGLLSAFSAFIVEWHEHGPEEIVEILRQHEFAIHVAPTSPDQRTLGLVYAIRLPTGSGA